MIPQELNIHQAVDSIWRQWFARGDWSAWRAFLAALFGLPMSGAELAVFRECTGRDAAPAGGATEAWLIIGRRGGKSFVLATIAVFLAIFRDWSAYLTAGERGIVTIICTDRKAARVAFRYCRALIANVPALASLIERERDDALDLSNGISIEIMTASWRSVRGYTIVAAIGDEIAFWPVEDTAANPDAEIIAALRPAMATLPGAMLLCASSPYAKRGALFEAYREGYGNEDAEALVWQAPTLTMNPSVRRSVIDKAYEKDPASAAAEYGAEFRTDLEAYLAHEIIEACTATGRHELAPMKGIVYTAFVDPAGGSGKDSMTMAIVHRGEDGRVILDLVREKRPPFSPEIVVAEFAGTLKAYRITKVTGDHWGGEFVREPFRGQGVTYELADRPKSDFYRDALPVFNSGKIELYPLPRLAAQLGGSGAPHEQGR